MPLNHCTIVPLNHCTIVPLYPYALAPLYPCTLVPFKPFIIFAPRKFYFMAEEDKTTEKLKQEEIETCISVLEHLLKNGDQLVDLSGDQFMKLMKAAGQITRPDKAEIKKRNKSVKAVRRRQEIDHNRKARAATSIRSARTASVFEAPAQVALPSAETQVAKRYLISPQNCYVCKYY